MFEEMRKLLVLLEAHATELDAKYRAAKDARHKAEEEEQRATNHSAAADALVDIMRKFLEGSYSEVPL